MIVVERWLFKEVGLSISQYVKVVLTRFKLTIVYAHDMFRWLGFHYNTSSELGQISHFIKIVIQARLSELIRDKVGHPAT